MNKTYIFPKRDCDSPSRFALKKRPISKHLDRALSTGKLLTIHDFAKVEVGNELD